MSVKPTHSPSRLGARSRGAAQCQTSESEHSANRQGLSARLRDWMTPKGPPCFDSARKRAPQSTAETVDINQDTVRSLSTSCCPPINLSTTLRSDSLFRVCQRAARSQSPEHRLRKRSRHEHTAHHRKSNRAQKSFTVHAFLNAPMSPLPMCLAPKCNTASKGPWMTLSKRQRLMIGPASWSA